jgi:hypothetical protein
MQARRPGVIASMPMFVSELKQTISAFVIVCGVLTAAVIVVF